MSNYSYYPFIVRIITVNGDSLFQIHVPEYL
jgi:hypothetical protein